MGRRREQVEFVQAFLRERATIRFGALLRRDPLCRLQLEPGRIDPYPIYDQVRRRGPLSRSTVGVWVTASHEVCQQVLRDRRFGATDDASRGPTPQLSFLEMNPPDHTRLRRFVIPAFSPKAVAGFTPVIEPVAESLLAAAGAGRDGFDLISTLAAPMPIAVITALLGIPDADAEQFARYGATFGSALGGLQSIKHAGELAHAQRQLEKIFVRQFEARSANPGSDDLIGRLMQTSRGQIRAEEMVPLCTLLLIAGFETTVNLIGNTVLALLERPAVWRRLVDDPTLVEAAVEETLRFDPPVQRTGRMALEDVTVAGRQVKRGDIVVTLLGGANRDIAVFDHPATYDLDRPNRNDHLAFSAGIHYCVGAPLARLEATIAIRTLLARFPDLALAGELVRRPGSLIRGMARFPVRATRARVLGPVAT